MTPEQRRHTALFVWAGCGMHKEMNSVKGGVAGAAAAIGGSAARKRAEEASDTGAIKFVKLIGAILNNKDKKRGSTTIQVALKEAFGFTIYFPDTGNTRYQSFREATAEVIVHLDFYRTFLTEVRDLKDKRTWTNLEKNSVSHAYMRTVRGLPATNMLDLLAFHKNLIDFLRKEDVATAGGRFCGLEDAPSLPHLEGALVAFFEGALETWLRFCKEFADDGQIAALTDSERRRAFLQPTNDVNEGSLGTMRQMTRRAANMTINQQNARTMYQKGHASGMRMDQQRDSGVAQAKANRAVIDGKRKKDTVHGKKLDDKIRDLLKVTPRMDPNDILERLGTVVELNLQLDWHCYHDVDIPAKSNFDGTITEREVVQRIIGGAGGANDDVDNIVDADGHDKLSDCEG
ncbi:hypothetical protein BOTBODRAFT_181941 [Botryobasidium botryosum FD-172 SS1]|uniref:Uncharacterized protein n=1 Tax=Botryobasidium botryosum (strain FD-172 SS1) TaxID=930990 RepID=A0A067LS44_BOTB1|nr:hypothetical protein BOTBODRAFT_181941 [Botryobasidium botryosum FD-172 SS1]